MPTAEVLLKLQSQVAPQIAQTAAAYKTLSAEEQKAELAATKYAQALNRVAQADARTATEEQRLAVQTANVARAQTQAEIASLRLASAQTKVGSGNSFAAQTADAFKGQILAMVGPVAIATASIAALKGAIDLGQSSAKIDATRQSFDALAISINTTGDLLLGKLRAAAKGTISDANLIQSANSGILLTEGQIAGNLPRLLEIARASAKATGDDVGFVFDSLVKGIARGSPLIIDNAKITLDAEGAFKRYAASVGKTTDELTRQEQQQATLNAVLEAGTQIIQKTGGATDTNAEAIARLSANAENAKNAFGTFISFGLGEAAIRLNATADGIGNVINWFKQFGTTVPGAEAALTAFDAEMAKSGDVTKAEAAYQAALADAQRAATAATAAATPVINANSQSAFTNAGAYNAAAAAALFYSRAQRDAATAAGAGALGRVLPHLTDPTGGLASGLGARFTSGFDQVAQQSRADDQRLADLRLQGRLTNAKTSAARIAILQGELAKATTAIERQRIQNEIDQEKRSGSTRIGSAQSTALQLADIARTSGDDRVRIERENQQRLADAQLEFDVRRSRSIEDYEEKRRSLLARHQIAQADELKRDFEKDQRRAQEDFDRNRRQTLRNNAEALGDQSTRVGNRVESIAARTAARGGTVGGGALPSLPRAPSGAPGTGGQALAQINLLLDGKVFAQGIWKSLAPIVDQELEITLQAVGIPGGGQLGVGGAG